MPLRLVPRRDRKLYRLVKRSGLRPVKRGEVLFRAGDPAACLYLVRTGHLRLFRGRKAEDSELEAGSRGPVLAVVGPWELTGEEALLPGVTRRLTGVAGEPTLVMALDPRAAQRALQSSQKSFEAFLRAKEGELALARTLAEGRRRGGAAMRLQGLLLDLAARFGRQEGESLRISFPLTHQLLADLSGSHRSTVTTLLNDWIYAGILEDDEKGLRILKPRALEPGEDPGPSVDPKSA